MGIQVNPINLNRLELQLARIQNLSAAPSSAVAGLIYFDTALSQFGCYSGTSWVYFSAGAAGAVTRSVNAANAGELVVAGGADKSISGFTTAGLLKIAAGIVAAAVPGTDYVTGNSTNAFTNKTFDAAGVGNSLVNLGTANFAVNVIDTDTTLAANSDTRVASQKAVAAFVAAKVVGLATPKGGIDASANPNYPAANVGDFYRVTVAGLIGGASGIAVTPGDVIENFATSIAGTQAAVGASWTIVQANVDQATTSTLGLTAFATATETAAKAVSTKAVTPSALTAFTKGYAQNFGDAAATTFTITHNLGTLNVLVMIRLNSTGEQVMMDNIAATINTVTLAPAGAVPTLNQYNIIIIGI